MREIVVETGVLDVLQDVQKEVPKKIRALLANVDGLGETGEEEKIIPVSIESKNFEAS